MIIQFYNRREELDKISRYLDRAGFDLIIIYGRRRIGKTTLILEATKKKERIYYMAIDKNNLKSFHEQCSKKFPEIRRLKEDWEIIFDYIKDKIDVVIIDEFQNLIREDKSVISIFQRIVDSYLQNSNLKLVLLGSTISVMTSKVLSYRSPLYGRKSLSLNLKPVKFACLKEFFPSKNIKELIEIYGFADGIPFYLAKIDKDINFWEWLKHEIEEKSFILDEVDFLMRYEFADVGTYKAILQAISFGKTKINEIKDFTGLKRTDITPYLRNLIEAGFVIKETPIFDKPKSKKGVYLLSDNFLTFWFRYIYPNISPIEEGIFDISLIKHDYKSYLGAIFEKICKEAIIELIKQKEIPWFTKIGKQWGRFSKKKKTYEIDIVAVNEKTREILFAECKWRDNVDANKICRELLEKSRISKEKKEYFCIFARNFKKKIEEFEERRVYCFDLNDLERIFGIER